MAKQTVKTSEKIPFYIPTTLGETIKVVVTGMGVGLLIVLFSELIARYLIEPIFCRSTDSFSVCANGGNVAFYAATIIISMIAVAVLVRLGVFRPLLVALGAAAILWGIKSFLVNLSFLEYALWVAVLYGVTYAFLFWILRIRNFLLSLAITLVFVVIARIVLVS